MEIDFPGPEDPRPPYGRDGHPYFLHEMIRSQPDAVDRTVRSLTTQWARLPAPKGPVVCTGLGTSYHAALAAAGAVDGAAPRGPVVHAVDAFELLLRPERIRAWSGAVVFSSSGETALTVAAQEALKRVGVRQLLVSPATGSRSAALADHQLRTRDAEEKAWVHTVSYTTAVAAAAGQFRAWWPAATPDPAALVDPLRRMVEREEEWRALAERLRGYERWLLVGSGPARATVREAALKLREGAHRPVATVGVEEFLHGYLPSIDRSTVVLTVATSANEQRRAETVTRAAEKAGATAVLFGHAEATSDERHVALPDVPSPLSPATDIVAFQFLTYWLAVGEGRNPDVMGYDDPRVFEARKSYGI